MNRPHDEPAFPEALAFNSNGEAVTASCYFPGVCGLTKRELFAARALQGLLSNAAIAEGVTKVKETLTQEQAKEFETKILPMANAICALSHADALLSALNQQPEAKLPEHKEVG